MKIRMDRKSLRLRLKSSETETFLRDGRIAENIPLTPGRPLVFNLEQNPRVTEPTLEFEGDRITISIPLDPAEPQKIGARLRQGIRFDKLSLSIAIEEDFDA